MPQVNGALACHKWHRHNQDVWRIEEHRRIDKQLSGAVPREILKRYEKWKDIARLSGPPGLRAIRGLHDAELAGEWKGSRPSRLGLQSRVIYRIVSEALQVQAIQVAPARFQGNLK